MPVVLREKEIWLPALIVVAIMTIIFLIVRSMMAQGALRNLPAAPIAVGSSPHQSSANPTSPSPQAGVSALGVSVFPSRNQGPDLQKADESNCLSWATNQTGIDPNTLAQVKAMSPSPQATQESSSDPSKGAAAKGAVRGAAAGAAIGAVTEDAGTGAAVGATAGAVRGRRQGRKAKKKTEEQEQAQTQQLAEADAQVADRKSTYNKAFSACMEGKGYTVK